MLIATVLAAWLQYAADGKPHARAVVSDAACPAAQIDGRSEPMTERAGKSAAFGDVVCDAAIASVAKRIRIGERELPAPVHEPRTIVVLGDTGCRLSAAVKQSCNDPEAWQFPRIARSIAAVHPDLVIHVGDYLYREKPCGPLARCADSPYGDNAPAWYADFLSPAAPIFAAAPLILTRGNHEECKRAGVGWFRYLDPHAQTTCHDTTEPYAADLGGLRIVDFDSSVAEDRSAVAEHTPVYREELAGARSLVKGPTWFVTHRPPYTNVDERTAMGESLTPFDAVLAGHIHFFGAMNVAMLPPLLINGEGGATLDPNYAAFLGLAVGELRVQGPVFGEARFGFGVYTRTNAGWTISLREADGAERARCTLAHRAVRCQAGE